MSFIKINNLKKSFGSLEVLTGINFEVNKGDVIAIIGSSGSGKSTLLRCLIDLEKIDGGSVCVDNEYLISNGVYANKNKVKEITAKMGMVFQSFNLFPHMTVEKNLTVPYMLTTGSTKQQALERCELMLNKVGMSDKAKQYPSKLSGGQKQRAAIARALMKSPEIMLFDEPTSALDPELTGEVLNTMKQLAAEHMTMIVVTHEMSFAKNVATKVVFMDSGKIIEEGAPAEFFSSPKNKRTVEFLSGAVNKDQ